MYCPLCQAEHRQGFTECSGCHIGLVATQEEANQIKTDRIRTYDGIVLNALLDCLKEGNIPFRSRAGCCVQAPGLGFLFCFGATPN